MTHPHSLSGELVERAPRYDMQLSVRYRERDSTWEVGRTKNVSASGVLFEMARTSSVRFQVDSPLEMNLLMPPEIVGADAVRVVCTGRVARIVADESSARAYVAATIVRYRLERGHGREPRR